MSVHQSALTKTILRHRNQLTESLGLDRGLMITWTILISHCSLKQEMYAQNMIDQIQFEFYHAIFKWFSFTKNALHKEKSKGTSAMAWNKSIGTFYFITKNTPNENE